MYVCVYTYICVCVYIYIHIYTHTYIYIYERYLGWMLLNSLIIPLGLATRDGWVNFVMG
jgi:hypothetical protein